MNKNHVKKFHDQYSQSREAQLIEYLNQRDADVPKLILNSPSELNIEMEFVGESLETIFSCYYKKNPHDVLQAIRFLRSSIQVSFQIADLRVWHYDLALRNFTAFKKNQNKSDAVFLIDFGAAVSDLFLLQKPLWLRPDVNIHHRELVDALESDWIVFFKRNKLNIPQIINNEFSIPIENYNKYWDSTFSVQQISEPLSVISHSIGVMIDDCFVKYPFFTGLLSKSQQKKIGFVSKDLRNLNSDKKVESCIYELTKILDEIILELEKTTGATPRPGLKSGNKNLNLSANPNKNIKFNRNELSHVDVKKSLKYSVFLFVLIFCFFCIDYIYKANNVLLSDSAYNVSLFALFLLPLTITAIFFLKNANFIFKSFIRVESLCVTYYLYELFTLQINLEILILIFLSVMLVFLLTFKN